MGEIQEGHLPGLGGVVGILVGESGGVEAVHIRHHTAMDLERPTGTAPIPDGGWPSSRLHLGHGKEEGDGDEVGHTVSGR